MHDMYIYIVDWVSKTWSYICSALTSISYLITCQHMLSMRLIYFYIKSLTEDMIMLILDVFAYVQYMHIMCFRQLTHVLINYYSRICVWLILFWNWCLWKQLMILLTHSCSMLIWAWVQHMWSVCSQFNLCKRTQLEFSLKMSSSSASACALCMFDRCLS